MDKKEPSQSFQTRCNYCGQNLKPEMRYCSNCGKKVDEIMDLSEGHYLYSKFKIEPSSEDIFDSKKNLFILDIKNSLILNEDNIILGYFEVKDKLINYTINVYSNKQLEFKISPKILSLSETFKIKNQYNQLIAKVRKKLFSWEFYDLDVISPRGEKWFNIKSAKNFKSSIRSYATNKPVSIFGPLKAFKNFLFNLGVKDPKFLYILKVLDKHADIKILLSAFLVYYINVYSKYF
ncbi:MAG: zinc ribbon domain-containing protein [Candidatus Lokiarchaeota archaeon]